ncbi:hypothetical protein [Treponema pedis]|uniref:Uncharacterized protein n=2 Tax=Treponema pedis TaxID=409322 RepID=A0A7S7AY52_9SPIR|nr:hypothetical protein [Treponema pedis]QOW62256.1 hypothetical protein IFE08_13090 [Treponema pedis]
MEPIKAFFRRKIKIIAVKKDIARRKVEMKQKRLVSMIGALVLIISAVFMITGCPDQPIEKVEYSKENFVLKFKNESGQKCYIEIKGYSRYPGGIIGGDWTSSFDFPTVLKTEIPIGVEKSITVKDVVVSGKTSKLSYSYNPRFDIHVIPDSSMYSDKWKTFVSESKTQYTEGIFHIKLEGSTFKVDYTN